MTHLGMWFYLYNMDLGLMQLYEKVIGSLAECIYPLTDDVNISVLESPQQLHSLLSTNPKAQMLFFELVKELKKVPSRERV